MQTHSINHSDVKKVYGIYAPIYDFVFGAVLEPGRRALAREVAALQPGSLLEIGVGTGLLLDKYPVTSEVSGIDISDDMLALARMKARGMPRARIQLLNMDAEDLQFEDGSFDCVVLPYVLSVTPDPAALVKEARRVCRTNGAILILNHFSGDGRWRAFEKLLANIAEKIGFRSDFPYAEHILRHDWEVEKVESVNLLGLSKLIVIRNT